MPGQRCNDFGAAIRIGDSLRAEEARKRLAILAVTDSPDGARGPSHVALKRAAATAQGMGGIHTVQNTRLEGFPRNLKSALHPVARRALVALPARERGAEHAGASLRGRHPGTISPGRGMPHVLIVAAFQLGDPVKLVVLVKACDAPLHATRFISRKAPAPAPARNRRGSARRSAQSSSVPRA